MRQFLNIVIILLLCTLSLFAKRKKTEEPNEFYDDVQVTEEPATRQSATMERIQLPPPRHDTILGNFVIYWNAEETERLGRSVDTLESKAYISYYFNIFDTTIRESVEFGRVDVKPLDTDSMLVNGKICYPSRGHQVWVFPIPSGKIKLYSAHPDTILLLHYGFSTNNIYHLPKRGHLVTMGDTLNQSFNNLLADSLARVPRAFFEYSHDIKRSIEIYNKTPEEDYLQIEGSQTIAMMTMEVFNLRRPHRRLPIINSLLISDPYNPIALMRMIEAFARRDFAVAQKYYNRLNKVVDEEDYLLIYSKALLMEAQDDLDMARVLYDMALEMTTEGTLPWNRIHAAVLRLTPGY